MTDESIYQSNNLNMSHLDEQDKALDELIEYHFELYTKGFIGIAELYSTLITLRPNWNIEELLKHIESLAYVRFKEITKSIGKKLTKKESKEILKSKKKLRKEGLKRCNNVSELSGDKGSVETCHINHRKDDKKIYLDSNNVVMCTPFEHYVYHLMFKGKAHFIGLSEDDNNFAINKTFNRAILWLMISRKIDFINLSDDQKQKMISITWN